MIHAEILDLLSLAAQRSPSAAPLSSTNAFAQRSPGERFNAVVESSLEQNLFKVRVDGQVFAMRLPPQVSTGNHLDLVLLANGPRPVFALQEGRPLDAMLSPAARLIGELARQSPQPSIQTAETGAALAIALTDTEALTSALKNTIDASGLFYESHQAQWVRGERGLDALRAEPQAQLASVHAAETPPPGSPAAARRTEAASPAHANAERNGVPVIDAGANRSMQTAIDPVARDAPPVSKETLADPQVMNLVRQQIDTLDSREIFWQGEIWPRQMAQWSIQEEPPDEKNPEAPPEWRSRLRLDLPELGEVHASLELRAAGLAVRIHANPATVANLRAHLPQLARSLDARGISVLGLEVADAARS